MLLLITINESIEILLFREKEQLSDKGNSMTQEVQTKMPDGVKSLQNAMVSLRSEGGWQVSKGYMKSKLRSMSAEELRKAALAEIRTAFSGARLAGHISDALFQDVMRASEQSNFEQLAGHLGKIDKTYKFSEKMPRFSDGNLKKEGDRTRLQQQYTDAAEEIVKELKSDRRV